MMEGYKIIVIMKTTIALFLFSLLSFGQSAVVAAGNQTETIGEVFPIMQQLDTVIEVRLGTPKFEVPAEKPKPVIKKRHNTFFEKLIEFIKALISRI